MLALLRHLWMRLWRQPARPQVQGMTCIHLAFTACQYRAKGTTPGYKGAGWYKQCLGCRVWFPC